ncbi:MAG: hypothetical protein GY721_10810 [Deltaproteobacteria bacterium]|nr:hypothetical protein [Deltaproteobacteria bacterium]
MAKSVTALKNVLKHEEALLLKLKETVVLMIHKESKALVREMMKIKRVDIRNYKKIIKQSEKCPAIKKKTR